MNDANHPYADLLHMPRPAQHVRPAMPRQDRAAQFAPFAALTGHNAAIVETARITQARIQLTEEERERLDGKQQLLQAHLSQCPVVTVTYFQPDERKEGGTYQKVSGRFRGINDLRRILFLTEGMEIPLDDIVELDSTLFYQIDM